ncbi:glycine betaine ABC transporter substrate-binding protein [Hoeflea prorocentri]|uniref:Glycine/betaine ABC transporter substrate-binding protein n=1 Tax=Hoeflea prorocentri TaxID=1922333 RepID=A0A9X3ZIT3_9HYPH|nr:glycine betaine ABC transporter substrate-binding protein [Hoeflea prorocentri]MCY6382065.1 glycine/betaine ABC transporter substrate-binding protein [Hoeflea prorocentri]MDA5399865.1 glycine/betaine ABC transporter substrate-binding protein [Hoeflea prorocentri]
MKRLILAACFAATTSLSAHAASDTVMIGEPSWPGAKIIANLIKVVIEEKLGGQAELVPGTNPVIFAAMDGGRGDIDVHPDVWLPNQKSLTDEYVDGKGTVGLSSGAYEGRSGFCVPSYMAEEHNIKSVFDLATPEAQELFDADGDGKGEIWVGASGWASTNVHKVKARDYGIETFLEPGTEDETVFYAKLKDVVAQKKGAVFYCYKPHYVHALYDVTMLEEPEHDPETYKIVQPDADADWYDKSKITSGDSVKSVRIAHSKSLEERAPDAAKLLANMELNSDDVSAWTFEVVVNGKEPEDVVRAWVQENGPAVDAWLGIK